MTRISFAIGTTLVCFFGTLAFATQSITKVDRLCGYLVSETQTGRDSIPGEKIALYRRESTLDCCNAQDQLAGVQTKRDGKFEFKHIPAGAYWIVAVVENREYRMAIDFSPTKNAQDCKWNLYTIERDKFVLKTYLD
ncbi:MAG TPA: hypothetical protein VFF95_01550 [Candidatus Binatus sp.]|jgi:hypothetical protein|nr:hypothetical protein [Candidatus Binatus sp.]